jgi:thermostable 8-oxoguanine DNA glycosylase
MLVERKAHGGWRILFGRRDLVRWRRVIKAFGPVVDETQSNWWKGASNKELWKRFVGEFAVRGGVRLIERLQKDKKKQKQYYALISLRSLANIGSPAPQLRRAMRMATRFWPNAAKTLAKCLRNPNVVKGSRFVLLEDLPGDGNDLEWRELLLERCPEIGRKGASDFLVGVGAAQNLAAIDTRIIGCLKEYFSAGPEIKYARSSKAGYLALESALRQVAQTNHIPLSRLDRIIFQASGMSAFDFVVRR